MKKIFPQDQKSIQELENMINKEKRKNKKIVEEDNEQDKEWVILIFINFKTNPKFRISFF